MVRHSGWLQVFEHNMLFVLIVLAFHFSRGVFGWYWFGLGRRVVWGSGTDAGRPAARPSKQMQTNYSLNSPAEKYSDLLKAFGNPELHFFSGRNVEQNYALGWILRVPWPCLADVGGRGKACSADCRVQRGFRDSQQFQTGLISKVVIYILVWSKLLLAQVHSS